jgi:AsmA protein
MAFGVDTTVAGRLDADVRARGALRRPALEGWARLRDVAISGARMRGTVRTPALELTLTPHEIRTGDVSATTNGTAVSGRLAVADYTGSPSIDVTVRAQDASVGDLLDVGRAWGVRAVERVAGTGRATLDIRVRGPAGGRTWDGRATLAESTIEASAVGTPVRVDRAVATFSRDAATVEPFAASVGRTRATGRLILRHLATPAAEFDISADRIDVAELRRLAAPATRTGDAAGRDGILQRATGIGRLRVGALENGELRLDDVDAAVVLDRGLIRLDPLSASLYGGQHRGAVSIDARGAATAFATRSRLEGVDASRLLAAVSGVRDVVHGSLTSDAAVSFATDGTANMAKSLNGTFSLNVADARIANIDLWNAVESIGRFVPRARPASSRQTASVSGTFRVDAGVARTDDLTATLEGAILGAAGAIDLSDHRLDFRVAAVLSADNSRRVATTGLGGLMATVLGNDRGELVVPLTITGTMEHPLFAPDLPRLAEMKLRRRAPTFASPGDLTADILGHLGNAGAETPTRLLDDLLEALAGRGARRMPQAPVGAQPPPPKQAAPREQPGDPARAIEDALRRLLDGRKPK